MKNQFPIYLVPVKYNGVNGWSGVYWFVAENAIEKLSKYCPNCGSKMKK